MARQRVRFAGAAADLPCMDSDPPAAMSVRQ
jgi:hypothetical protein